MGTGPCAGHLHARGQSCPYGPDLSFYPVYYPACCDADGCVCECISRCAAAPDVAEVLGGSVLDFDFRECTTEVQSEAEATQWRAEKCKDESKE